MDHQRRRRFESAASLALFLCFLLASPSRALGDGVTNTKAEAKVRLENEEKRG
jgi:hypothetical protein